jgi:uncharacterized protein (DUF1501 family)
MHVTRREFLLQTGQACVGYALGAAAFVAGVQRFALINAFAQGTDYRALVCVFLAGGNDGNNMVIPLDPSEYNAYYAVRNPSGLAIPADSLLPIDPAAMGSPFGLHPNLTGLHDLWTSQKLSLVCNVGPLVEPLTREQYLAGAPRPYQLFSHSDQIAQWQSAIADRVSPTGWGGRTADRFEPHSSGFPTVTAVSGGLFTRGLMTSPLSIAPAPTALNQVLVLNGFRTSAADSARRTSMEYLRTIDEHALVRSASTTVQRALDIGQILDSEVVLGTVFPNTNLGNQLKQIAKVIRFNAISPNLRLQRQIFFCQLGGFDTHQGQVNGQGNLLTQVSAAIRAFYDATVEIGVEGLVTTFTLSDFGRTFQPAGSGPGTVGTDHAWGNHHFVIGGSVRGGDFYGVAGPNGTVFPVLRLSGPSDTDNRGRWIPTVAVEQYAATLASWYGVAAGDLPLVFPNIGRFPTVDLGFMN